LVFGGKAVKVGIHNPVLSPKAGFFILGNMKIRIWNNTRTWNLKASAFVSLGIHLLLIFAVSNLFSNAKVHQNPVLFVKVTLHALENEKESLPAFTPPLPTKNQVQKPDKRDPVREPKQKEPMLKSEVVPPIPLPVHAAVKDLPAEEPERILSSREEEKTANEPSNPIRVAALGTDSYLSREENLSVPAPSPLTGGAEENQASGKPSGNATGTEQGGSPGGGPGKGSGTAKEGLPSSGSGEGTGLGQGGSGKGGSGNGSGAGTGSGQGSPRGGVSRKGSGIFAKLFSSSAGGGGGGSGGAGGTHPRYAENPNPPYPREARERGHQGEVLLRVEVLVNGRVGQIEIKRSSGHESLDQSALSTVKQWKFVPAKKGENPVPLWVHIPIKFQLQ
jgi:TonB family protein